MFFGFACLIFMNRPHAQDMAAGATVTIGNQAMLADNPRTHFGRCVNDAPVEGETLRLNPPRFRWRYHPDGNRGGLFMFVFQIADSHEFDDMIVDVTTPFNFYNTIAPFSGRGPYYWRVGYIEGESADGKKPFRWSPVRSFRIAADAQVWDRSMLAEPDFSIKPHPRIMLTDGNREKILRQIKTDTETRIIFNKIRSAADETLTKPWYIDFPVSDKEEAPEIFYRMTHELCHLAFMYRLNGEEKYASVIPRAVTFASYQRGGRTSPEPIGESNEDSTQNTEFLALLYDWLYPDLTQSERNVFVKSLEWRIDHFVNNFAWKRTRDGKRTVHMGSLATIGASHSYEGFWDTFPAGLAIYEESEVARVCVHLGVNWMAGVSSSHGFDEGWNEGPGYANSKFKWMLNAMLYLDSVFPEFRTGSNPWLRRIGEWFCRVTPVGMNYAPWGHQSNYRNYYEYGRISNFRRFAYLTGDGVLLRNWKETGGVRSMERISFRLWTECILPVLYEKPDEQPEDDPVGFFPLAGWVMAGTQPPSTSGCYENSVGMIFQCRPLGAYSHSFANENSFHIYGYGEDLSYASGTSEYEPHAFHTMSHNTILIDGLGQSQPNPPETPRVGYLRAFQRGEGYVYWAGDATDAYSKKPLERSGGWWGTLDPIYNERDAGHLKLFIRHVVFLRGKYFVIFDDLACEKPAKYTWLYHILPHDPVLFDDEGWTIDYTVGDVPVRIAHIAHRDNLELIDMQGDKGFINPLTGEDYTDKLGRLPGGERREGYLAGHNLYVSNTRKTKEFHFLSVIAPVKPGEKFPEIERIDDRTVSIDGDVISFDPETKYKAHLIIDTAAISVKQPALTSSK